MRILELLVQIADSPDKKCDGLTCQGWLTREPFREGVPVHPDELHVRQSNGGSGPMNPWPEERLFTEEIPITQDSQAAFRCLVATHTPHPP